MNDGFDLAPGEQTQRPVNRRKSIMGVGNDADEHG
jgi:hypothetical protein